jgi:hypothetical protein
MRTEDGRTVSVSTGYDVIRLGVRDRAGERRVWEVFTIAEAQTLEHALKAARDKSARKYVKKAKR